MLPLSGAFIARFHYFLIKQGFTNFSLTLRDQQDIYVPLTESLFKSAGITVSHFFAMLPSILKYLYSIEPVRMHFPAKQPYCANDTVCNAAMQHCTQYLETICSTSFLLPLLQEGVVVEILIWAEFQKVC